MYASSFITTYYDVPDLKEPNIIKRIYLIEPEGSRKFMVFLSFWAGFYRYENDKIDFKDFKFI